MLFKAVLPPLFSFTYFALLLYTIKFGFSDFKSTLYDSVAFFTMWAY